MLSKIGKRQIQMLSGFIGSAACFGATGFCALTYVTEWRWLLQHLPYYNGKYKAIKD